MKCDHRSLNINKKVMHFDLGLTKGNKTTAKFTPVEAVKRILKKLKFWCFGITSNFSGSPYLFINTILKLEKTRHFKIRKCCLNHLLHYKLNVILGLL